MFSAIAYFLLPNPIMLLLIAGIWAALGLPIINIGALYLTSKLSKDLQPKPITKNRKIGYVPNSQPKPNPIPKPMGIPDTNSITIRQAILAIV